MEKKNKTPCEKEKCAKGINACCYGNCSKKFKWAFFTAVLIGVCAISEHLYNEHNYMKFSEGTKIETQYIIEKSQKSYSMNIADLKREISFLKGEVALLKANIANKKNESDEYYYNQDKDNTAREKWKIWSNLRAKMEMSLAFDRELKAFINAFAHDKELIALVNVLAKGVYVTSNTTEQNNNVIDICKKYIKRMIRVKKIDYRKLLEISGYVLSSVQNQN